MDGLNIYVIKTGKYSILLDCPDTIERLSGLQADSFRVQLKVNGDIDSAQVKLKGEWIRLHRLILGLGRGSTNHVDHINGNPLDNRLCNLRICTNAENQMNARPHRDKKSGLPKGVTLSKTNPNYPYQVRISVLGTRIQVGYYATAEQAEQAYLAVAAGLHGKFAYHTSRKEK